MQLLLSEPNRFIVFADQFVLMLTHTHFGPFELFWAIRTHARSVIRTHNILNHYVCINLIKQIVNVLFNVNNEYIYNCYFH